jgi:hypothetical protein
MEMNSLVIADRIEAWIGGRGGALIALHDIFKVAFVVSIAGSVLWQWLL